MADNLPNLVVAKPLKVSRLSDIAHRLGISTMTVSRALNPRHKDRVGDALREQIEAVARELNYRHNTAAQALTHRRSFSIGVLHAAGNARFVPGCSRGIQGVFADEGFAPVVYIHDTLAEEARFLDQCLNRGVEGLIVNLSVDYDDGHNAALFGKIRDAGLPIVEINGRFIEGVSHVRADFFGGAAALMDGLIRLGHKRIALYINDAYRIHESRPGVHWTTNAVWRAYQQKMADAGLESRSVTFPAETWRLEHVEQLVSVPDQTPTAVLCASVRVAELMTYFISNTPAARNMKLAFYGAVEGHSAVLPDALRLEFPGVRIGETAAQLILKQLEGGPVEDIDVPSPGIEKLTGSKNV